MTLKTPFTAAETAVRRYYDLVDADDVPGLLDLFSADATYHRPGYEPMAGREAMGRFYLENRVIATGRHSVSTVVEHGEEVAVHGEFHGELRDGRTVGLRFADFFRMAPDGRFARRDTFFFAPLV